MTRSPLSRRLLLLLFPALMSSASITAPVFTPATTSATTAPWLADRGDGQFRNPVLYADYSDPDAIRVGDDYWMTASSFSHVPGLPVLHSRDLVNWTLVNHALPAIPPLEHFTQPRHGQGVWAPALRHHAGLFWIFFPDPDFGIYVTTAKDPRGTWSTPLLLKAGKGLIDPCPLWDEDGQAYLIHGWAKSRAGICNLLTLHRMTPEGDRLLDEGKIIIDANLLPGWRTLEGPKLYKRHGWYYVFAPAGGVSEGYQAIFRSRDIFGPYENRIVLEQGKSPVNGPHQGAWVDTPTGENWFFHFQELPTYGRVVHLQPMSWRDDDWPAMGINRDALGKGEPALVHAKPALPVQPIAAPATSDDFEQPKLGLQWQWQGNPRADWSSLTTRPGWLRLTSVAARTLNSHWDATHLLMQKLPAPAFTATTLLDFAPATTGDTAGLILFGYDYAWLGLKKTPDGLSLVLTTCTAAQKDGLQKLAVELPVTAPRIHLRVTLAAGALARFSYSLDGETFLPIGGEFTASSSHWVGAKVGLFATSLPDTASAGHADFGFFNVTAPTP